MLVACVTDADQADQAQTVDPTNPPAEMVELPGITIDTKNKRVDVAATIALDRGLLELVACTRDSKEHESLVMIDSVPMHVHAALLLIGASNGNPAMIKAANEERTQWLHLPPRGDPIAVSLVFADPEDQDKQIERPISDFIRRAEREPAPDEAEEDDGVAKVFESFVFAGSHLIKREDGEQIYAADQSGNVVSISTFGDELLCLPSRQSQDNAVLIWEVDGKNLPKVGTKVTLRLTRKALAKEDQEQE